MLEYPSLTFKAAYGFSHACMLSYISHVQLFCDPVNYWSGMPGPPARDLPNPGIEPMSLSLLHWQADSLPLASPLGKQKQILISTHKVLLSSKEDRILVLTTC